MSYVEPELAVKYAIASTEILMYYPSERVDEMWFLIKRQIISELFINRFEFDSGTDMTCAFDAYIGECIEVLVDDFE